MESRVNLLLPTYIKRAAKRENCIIMEMARCMLKKNFQTLIEAIQKCERDDNSTGLFEEQPSIAHFKYLEAIVLCMYTMLLGSSGMRRAKRYLPGYNIESKGHWLYNLIQSRLF